MKTRARWLVVLWMAGALGWGGVTGRSAHAEASLRDTMRFKLHFAQGVLEGITTENFPLIATNALKLAQLARGPEWSVRATPDYERFTADYLRQADALARAAKRQNVDSATVAYFQLTVSCVNCHRHLRGVEPVKSDRPISPRTQLIATADPSAGRMGTPGRSGQFPGGLPQPRDGQPGPVR